MKLKNGKKNTNKKSILNIALNVALVVFSLTFVTAVCLLVHSLGEYSRAKSEYQSLADLAITIPNAEEPTLSSSLDVAHDKLSDKNDRYVGWIDIPDTVVSYPMVYAVNYFEYLYTTFEKESNNSGCIFLDFRCKPDFSSKNTIIYGHRMNDGTMFGTLKNYFNKEYFDEHRIINIYTPDGTRMYEVFAVYYAISGDRSYDVDFESDEAYSEWLNYVVTNSAVKSNVDPSKSENVIMLSTCKGGDNEDRCVVFAALTSKNSEL